MAAQLDLYIDTTDNAFIGGLNTTANVNPFDLPLFYGDTISLRIYLMDKLQTTNPSIFPYEILGTAGLQLFLYLDDGLVAGTIYTQQITWSTDANNQYFYANLALNTAALATLLGSATSRECYLKIGYVQGGLQTTVISRQVQIGVGIPSVALVVPPGQTPLSAEVAAATFFPLTPVAGQPLFIMSPAGKIFMMRAVDNADGTASPEGWTQIN